MSDKKKYDITILGQTYTVKSDQSQAVMDSIMNKINNTVVDLRAKGPNLSRDMMLSLSLLYFGDEIVENESKIEELTMNLGNLRNRYNLRDEHNEKLEKAIKELKADLLRQKEQINTYENNRKTMEEEIKKLKIELDNKDKKIQNLNRNNNFSQNGKGKK